MELHHFQLIFYPKKIARAKRNTLGLWKRTPTGLYPLFKTKIKTEPGFTTGRAEQYLVDKIAQTDEAKAGEVLNYYQAFMRKLGL